MNEYLAGRSKNDIYNLVKTTTNKFDSVFDIAGNDIYNVKTGNTSENNKFLDLAGNDKYNIKIQEIWI